MTRTLRILFACAAALLLLLGAPPADAGEGDIVLAAAQLSPKPVTLPSEIRRGRVLLYGPAKVTPPLREAKGIIHLYVEDVDFAGEAVEVEIYLVDASKKRGKLAIDPTNYVGSMANVAGGGRKPVLIAVEINDYEVGGKPHKPRTRLQKMSDMALALVVTRGTVKSFSRILITTDSPAQRDRR